MKAFKSSLWAAASAVVLTLAGGPARAAEAPPAGHYKNFRAAIYIAVSTTHTLADPARREREFQRAFGQVRFDKVYLEVYRDHDFASPAEIEAVKAFFKSKGVAVSGGITLAAGGHGGQFGTFDYENPADRAECEKAARLAAAHFDEVILDDFFFYASKSPADIAAKGARSWTQYRLDTMREVSRDLVLGPAKQVNPKVRMIIKYPNWYEHFQGLGYDLEQQSQMFDAIYTGTETRDPDATDQLLQQYESYEAYRYYSNIRPGADLGGWVDTFSTRYVDRYAEQLWDTLLAKAPEITLFNWTPMSEPRPVQPGERPWKGQATSFDWAAMAASYRGVGANDPGPGWGRVAGYSLEQIDKVLGGLGRPVGIPLYKPYQSSGDDFLPNYLGNLGLPIEQTPRFPMDGDMLILTEAAKADPDIVAKIKARLMAGHDVTITSGLLHALKGRGIDDIVELEDTGRVVSANTFLDGYGAGDGRPLNEPGVATPQILLPEIGFYTNDSWSLVRAVAGAKGYPILLMNRYGRGVLYVLTTPENPADLYNLPEPVLTRIKAFLQRDFAVRIAAPADVALFAYDNDALVAESYRPTVSTVQVSVKGAAKALRNLATGESVRAGPSEKLPDEAARTTFEITLPPHSYAAFKVER
ncbi:hypothetical protein [Phenylobacterium montanum]|uniref:Beta-galactosidase trimerisation domain-containing protein n=1 Tax=Phenylobacterium montanum TaxID=2823693 RepID=A0A975IVA5_9CAUL|nr:hypothetical protein [Caulobacter sp. S6]QUD88379.1 hypothetical protein KCG34_00335 [Caulobacter sp. S6]